MFRIHLIFLKSMGQKSFQDRICGKDLRRKTGKRELGYLAVVAKTEVQERDKSNTTSR